MGAQAPPLWAPGYTGDRMRRTQGQDLYAGAEGWCRVAKLQGLREPSEGFVFFSDLLTLAKADLLVLSSV